jgi:hypothetical protein
MFWITSEVKVTTSVESSSSNSERYERHSGSNKRYSSPTWYTTQQAERAKEEGTESSVESKREGKERGASYLNEEFLK